MPFPIISVEQMREWERATWATGQSEDAVMRLAGRAIAREARRMTKPGDFVVVLAGKGHNGDDARFAAESDGLLGRGVHVVNVLDPEAAISEVASSLERRPALIIDGLFGIGLNRPLSPSWIKLIREINESGAPILAVDVPSGLSSETGEPLDDAVRAGCTVTFGAVKQGLIKTSAAPFVGRLEVAADIGLVPCPFKAEINLIAAEDFLHFPPPRALSGHKGTFGHLALLAGSLGYHGAAVLAARGAQRAQPGLVTLFTADNVYHPVASQVQSVMVSPWSAALEGPDRSEEKPKTNPRLRFPDSCTAIAMGPGLASRDIPDYIKEMAGRWWQESPLAVIADASALEWLPPGPCRENALRVMTPHPGEAARLLQTSTAEVQKDRFEATRQLSRKWGNCFVVLKGHHSIIGRGDEPLFVNNTGNPFLAQGGSGDLLTGYLGGLLAQPPLQADPGKTIRYAVWQHGAAADSLLDTRRNWTVEDLAEVIGSFSPR